MSSRSKAARCRGPSPRRWRRPSRRTAFRCARATFRRRAVPVPGSLIREGAELTNDTRRDIPSTVIATGFSSADYQKAAAGHDQAWLAGLEDLRDLTWIDLPTSHWPMWSRPAELAALIGDVARAHATA